MGRSKTNSFVVTRRLILEPWQEDRINRCMHAINRMYNSGVRHYRRAVALLRADPRFIRLQEEHKELREGGADRELADKHKKQISVLLKEYGITEYAVHAWLAKRTQPASTSYRRQGQPCTGR